MVIEPLETRVMLSADGFIKAAGTVLRDGHGTGNPVLLQGTNLGGWLLKEGWMTPMDSSGSSPDDYTARQTILNRFGTEAGQRVLDAYEDSWITLNDLDNIKALGMNVVRVPFWYRNFQNEDGTPVSNAFKRLDWLVTNAWARGIYTILDFHGVVGGQSTADHTGRVRATAEFWTSPTDQQRTIDIWTQIAQHYAANPGVAAYDLINEPGGTPNSTTLWNMYDRMYHAIRAVDADHLITMEGTYGSWNWSMLPNPSTYGWTNVMYQMHEYQFGSTNDPAGIEAGTNNQVNDFNAHKSWNVPAYVGEWNDFGPAPDPSSVWAYTVAQYQAAGINWSEWSYKSSNGSGNNSWGIYDKLSAAPAVPNLQTDSDTTIIQKWSAWKTDTAAAVNPMLLAPLTIALGAMPGGFSDADVGGPSLAGKASFDSTQGTFTLWGSGADIFGTADQFNFASKAFTGDGSIVAQVSADSNTDPWAKSGVMFRDGTAAGAIYAAVLATPGNGVTFQWRNSTGAATSEAHVLNQSAPLWVRLVRAGNGFSAYYGFGGPWFQIGTTQVVTMNSNARVGLAVSSHNNAMLNTGTFKSVSALPSPWTSQEVGALRGGWASTDPTASNWTIAGGAEAVTSSFESLNFASRTWNGDFIIKAQVTGQSSINSNAKAGVMFRGSTSSDGVYAFVYVTPGNGIWFQWRSTTGVSSTGVQVNSAAAKWVKLIRSGNSFSGYYSSDGTNWTRIGTPQVINTTTPMVGLAVSSSDSSRLAEATLGNMTLTSKLSAALAGTGGNDSYYVRRNGNRLEVWRNTDGGGVAAASYDSDDYSSFSLDGGGGDDRFVLDFSGGDPLLASGNTMAGQAGNDVVRLIGLPTAAAVTMLSTNIIVGSLITDLAGVEVNEIGAGQLGSLTIDNAVRARLASPLLTVGNLSMSAFSQLDLMENDLLVSGGNLGTISGLVGSARNTGSGGRWTGSGITSSSAAANQFTGLAVLSRPAGVLVKYTWSGDFNGDGVINPDDFAIIDSGFINRSSGYGNGDLDYNGSIDADDYFYTDMGFGGQNQTLATPQAPASANAEPKARMAHHRRRRGPKTGRTRQTYPIWNVWERKWLLSGWNRG
jgi:endoglucanase